MPLYRVRRTVDAYVHYVASVRARSPRHAAVLAHDDEGKYEWIEEACDQFDGRAFVTLTDDDGEIESSRIGDF